MNITLLRTNLQSENKLNKKKKKDHGQTVAAAWLFMILAILPLYMQDGMNRIGDAKYMFFRNVSILFFAAATVIFIASELRRLSDRTGVFQESLKWSAVDICVLAFGFASIISCCLSDHFSTALLGYQDWYMGLIVQLLMVGEYFCISRCYRRDSWVEAGILFSAFVVSLLGVLNRFELDPLNVFSGMDRFDWNRANLLSTIGNINWYCGYLSVVVPLLAVAYWSWRGHWVGQAALGIALCSGLTALFIQGSDSGYAALIAMMLVLMFGSLGYRERRLRFLEILMMLPLTCLVINTIAKVVGVGLFLPNGSRVTGIVYSPIWILALVLLLLCYIFSKICKHEMSDSRFGKNMMWIAGAVVLFLAVVFVLVFITCQISDEVWRNFGEISLLRFDDDWGSGRGFLWRVTWQSFWDGDILQKLFGAGPDCYAEYMYHHNSMELQVSGQFQGAIFANAHNEWLTMLLNEGIIGAAAYIGFFLTAFVRFFRRVDTQPGLMAGALAVAVYCVNSFFSFQQVVSTPLIFLVIGACEANCRELPERTEQSDRSDGTDCRHERKKFFFLSFQS